MDAVTDLLAAVLGAEGEGWTKQAGIPLATSAFESGPNMIQALSSGSLDVYVAGVSMKVTQRDEFASVIQRNGGRVEALIAQLRQKLAISG